MHGVINIRAQVSIITKAKLDDIGVKGECLCGPGPTYAPVALDLVILIDGSDSFGSTCKDQSATKASTQFEECMDWAGRLIHDLGPERGDLTSVTVAQFSGFKNQDSNYKPDSDGILMKVGDTVLRQWQFEHGPVAFSGSDATLGAELRKHEGLDGNSQLFLALQDLSLPSFDKKLTEVLGNSDTHGDRKRLLVIITDEEWDANQLGQAEELSRSLGAELDAPTKRMSKFASHADADNHFYNELLPITTHLAHPFYNEVHPVIIRRNHFKDLEDDFIVKHVAKSETGDSSKSYHKIYEDTFFRDMESCKGKILSAIKRLVQPVAQ